MRYLGVAQNVGDVLTFLVYDEASRFVLAQSVLHPAENNKRVTWDSNLQGGNRPTAKTDTSARRGDPEGGLTSKQEEHDGGQPDKNTDTVSVITFRIWFGGSLFR